MRLFVLIAVLALTVLAAFADEHPPKDANTTAYSVSPQAMVPIVQAALNKEKIRSREFSTSSDGRVTTIQGVKPMSLSSWGEDVVVEITRQDDGTCTVTMRSKENSGQLIAWGQNSRNLKGVFKFIDGNIKSSKPPTVTAASITTHTKYFKLPIHLESSVGVASLAINGEKVNPFPLGTVASDLSAMVTLPANNEIDLTVTDMMGRQASATIKVPLADALTGSVLKVESKQVIIQVSGTVMKDDLLHITRMETLQISKDKAPVQITRDVALVTVVSLSGNIAICNITSQQTDIQPGDTIE